MRLLRIAAICTFSLGLCNCEHETLTSPEVAPPNTTIALFADDDQDEDGHVTIQSFPELEPIIHDHVDHHGLNLIDPEPILLKHPDGTSEQRFLVEEDIALTQAEMDQIRASLAAGEKQYRTNNLVNSPQTITILGYTGGGYGLTSKMRTALSWAVNNYNALNMGLSFTLSYGTNISAADIVVYQNPYNTGAGGVAGFPSNGNPYKWVQLYAGLDGFSTNVNEHVITHEIGHCLGLRHTDYATRASCGQNTNEGSAGVGAVHIPGTPTGFDEHSVMLACFNSSEDGEFGLYDRIALEYIY